MKFKSVFFSIAVALVLALTMGSAFAWYDEGSNQEVGDNMIFGYYDIRTAAQGGPGLTDNYFTVVNEDDDDDWVQAHVRVRTADCSVELLDFDVLLSPNDVFTFDLLQDAEGDTVFASCDTKTLTVSGFTVDANGCFVLDSGTFPNMLSLIQLCGNCPDGSGAPLSAETALDATRVGYVEVIGEAEMWEDSGRCQAVDECCEEDLEAGVTAWDWWNDSCPLNDIDDSLFGRVYYAAFDGARNLVRLGTSNAYGSNLVCGAFGCDGYIVHRPCYSDSSAGCSAGDGELENANPTTAAGVHYAYDAASTSPQGATDLNYCFWKNTIVTTGDVVNRVGAAATFGPTQADMDDFAAAPRSGIAGTTEQIISNLNSANQADEAVSHYFYIPGQGQTRSVFTFPFQHFVNQRIEITKEERFDTEEAECTLPGQKFISPGLPQPGEVAGEVTILTAHNSNDGCSFNEGWLKYDLNVASDGPGNTNYTPGVIGETVHWGDNETADVFSTAPMIFGQH